MELGKTALKKHLTQLNKQLREEYILKNVPKMNIEELKKNFNERFLKKESHYEPKGKYTVKNIQVFKNLIKTKPRPSVPASKPRPRVPSKAKPPTPAPRPKPAPRPTPAPQPAPKTTKGKEPLKQFPEEGTDKERLTAIFANAENRKRHREGKPQIFDLLKYKEDTIKRAAQTKAEERTRTRAKNLKKKEEEAKKTGFTQDEEKIIKIIGLEKYKSLKKIIDSKALKFNVVYVMSVIRAFFPFEYTLKLINKVGVAKMFNTYKLMLSKITRKQIFIPRHEGEFEGKGLPNNITQPILNYLM